MGLEDLAVQGIHSVLLEGGAKVHAAAWDAGVIDYVQLYVAPVWLGQDGVPLLEGRDFSPASLIERAGGATRSGCVDRRLCSPASLKPSGTSAASRLCRPDTASAHPHAAAPELASGESVAVNGVCLTVTVVEGDEWQADIGPETARVTTLGSLRPEQPVNLERSLRAGRSVRWPFRQGHVDGGHDREHARATATRTG